MRYKNITAKALKMGEIRFTRAPVSAKVGICEKKFPRRRKNGVPGGWGTPIITEVAINSPQSQKDVVGAMVKIYMTSENKNAMEANILLRLFNIP